MRDDNLICAFIRYGLCLFYAATSILEVLFDLLLAYLRQRRMRRYG